MGKKMGKIIIILIICIGVLLTCICYKLMNQKPHIFHYEKADKGRAWYYIDVNGQLISENAFWHVNDFDDDGIAHVEAIVGSEKKWNSIHGYIDDTGNFINNKYWESGAFNTYEKENNNEILLRTSEAEKHELFLLNKSMETIATVENVDCEDAYIDGPSDNGYFIVKTTEGKYGYIDKTGEWVIQPQFFSASKFQKGYAVVGVKGKGYGIIDELGNWTVEPNYNQIYYGGDCTFFRADIDKDGNGYYINIKDERLNNKQYCFDNLESEAKFQEGLCAVYDDEVDAVGYVDINGEYVIEPQFKHAENFINGVGRVCVEIDGQEKWAYINQNGDLLTDYIYDAVNDFDNQGFATVCKIIDGQEKWAYINKDFNCITDFEFDGVYLFSEDGFAAVKVEDKWGFIKEDGSWLLKPQFYSVQSFSNGYAAVSMMKDQEIEVE